MDITAPLPCPPTTMRPSHQNGSRISSIHFQDKQSQSATEYISKEYLQQAPATAEDCIAVSSLHSKAIPNICNKRYCFNISSQYQDAASSI
ncbi:hypothetical protein Nepgr_017384 [Nepenthes gracilis]|uniref:Uncharacterized protein n=1 Tax=Nepenthes gracilis TaxID=150966 RepID=A0AAD3SPB7_NEPGR|nr:hypothetical protein Nepgr_017384 [Nepenthes gracilis]